jgi:hypothetical protein
MIGLRLNPRILPERTVGGAPNVRLIRSRRRMRHAAALLGMLSSFSRSALALYGGMLFAKD